MRHRRGYRKLNKATDQRMALLRSLAGELIRRGAITVTVPRAKEVRRVAEKLVTLARAGTLVAQRRALSILPQKQTISQLFKAVPTQFEGRAGGYTRIYRLGSRRGDGVELARIELK